MRNILSLRDDVVDITDLRDCWVVPTRLLVLEERRKQCRTRVPQYRIRRSLDLQLRT